MCKKLIILCLALVVVGLSVPALADYVNLANLLKVDIDGGGVATPKAGWQSWQFATTWAAPQSQQFANPGAEHPWEYPIAQLSTYRKNQDPTGASSASRNRSGGFACVLGTDEFTPTGKGFGMNYVTLTLSQLEPDTKYKFSLWSYEKRNLWLCAPGNPDSKFAVWSTTNPKTWLDTHGYSGFNGEPNGYGPITPVPTPPTGESNMPAGLAALVAAEGGRASMIAPTNDNNDYLGGTNYLVSFYATTDDEGSIAIYGWIDPTDWIGSMHVPLNGFLVGIGDSNLPATGLTNPSFEGSFIPQNPLGYVAEYWTGWEEGYYGGYFNEGTYDAHQGTKSQMISWNGYGGQDFGPDGIYQTINSLEPSHIYRLSAWFKYQFESAMGSVQGNITCSVGADPNGGTNPDVVTNWTNVEWWFWNDWFNVVTFFSSTGPAATIFIKIDGHGDAWQEEPEPGPTDWHAYCYIDDVVVNQIEINPAASSVEATSPVPANGASYSEVTITVLDSNSIPVVGIPPSEVKINCTGSGNTIIGPDSPTDVNGKTSAKIASYIAETKIVSASVLGIALSDTATVHFCEARHMKFRASDGAAWDDFGRSVAIDDNAALIGAVWDDDKGFDSGSAYIFRFNGSSWGQEAKLLASDGAAYDSFGCSVAIDGNTALVGAYYDDDKGGDSGSAYIFRFNGSNWVQEAKLLASDGAADDRFGTSVAIDGNTALVGAYKDDDKGSDSGSAYIFRFNGSNFGCRKLNYWPLTALLVIISATLWPLMAIPLWLGHTTMTTKAAIPARPISSDSTAQLGPKRPNCSPLTAQLRTISAAL